MYLGIHQTQCYDSGLNVYGVSENHEGSQFGRCCSWPKTNVDVRHEPPMFCIFEIQTLSICHINGPYCWARVIHQRVIPATRHNRNYGQDDYICEPFMYIDDVTAILETKRSKKLIIIYLILIYCRTLLQ